MTIFHLIKYPLEKDPGDDSSGVMKLFYCDTSITLPEYLRQRFIVECQNFFDKNSFIPAKDMYKGYEYIYERMLLECEDPL